jgi:hypothetical protein
MAYSIAPPVDPGQEALAQTQSSVLNAVTTNPVSVPAPISDTAAKIGIFSTPTFPEPPVVSTPANPGTPAAGSAFNQGGLGSRATPEVAGLTTEQLAPGDTPAPSTNPNNGNSYTGGVGNATNDPPVIATPASTDWRVKLTLADSAYFLYMATGSDGPGILKPLFRTKGVIFPYTPSINMSYAANYDPIDITHNNYKIFQYKNSNVGDISITAEFTAQDTDEADYLLAVIHFFRSATKMFYGNDADPPNGTPPPLLYLSGYGQFQFDKHPVVISSFSYHLPQDVDYIKAGVLSGSAAGATPRETQNIPAPAQNLFQKAKSFLSSMLRLEGSGLQKGAVVNNPQFKSNQIATPTYVPTKISLTITLLPMVSRGDMSQRFSLKDYAHGKLYSGTASKHKGIW